MLLRPLFDSTPAVRTTTPKLDAKPPAAPRQAAVLRRLAEDGFDGPARGGPLFGEPSTANTDDWSVKLATVGMHYGDPGQKDHKLFSASGDLGDDVDQGYLGDCGLVASVSEIAHRNPNLLKSAITQNADGTVNVRLYDRVDPTDPSKGYTPRVITLDEKLPMNAVGAWSYAHTQSGDMFAPLIEKAFAIRNGGYGKIEGISPDDVMESLMGNGANDDYTPLSDKSPQQILDVVKSAYGQGQMLVAGTYSDAKKMSDNVQPQHAYSIEGVVQKDGKEYIEVRNPWGFEEPGNFLGPSDGKDDGRFLVSPENFKKWFADLYHVAPAAPVADADVAPRPVRGPF